MRSGALAPVGFDTPDVGAIRHAQDRVREHPRSAREYVDLARLFMVHAREYEDTSFYAQAKDAVRRAMEFAPTDPQLLTVDALLLLQDHRFREALESARRLIAAAPTSESYGILSDAALELGDYATAVDAAQRMNDMRPDAASYSRAAWLRWIHGDPEGAVEVMRLALGAPPRSAQGRAWLITQLGLLFWNQGDLEHAVEQFRDAITADPTFSSAHAGLARIALAQHDNATAMHEVEAALSANPSVENEWLASDVYAAAGRPTDAASHASNVERIGPRTDPRTFSLFLSTRRRNPELAIELAQQELQNRGDIFTEDALAWALAQGGRAGDARPHIDIATHTGIRDARILYHAGRIAQALNQRDDAIRTLSGALHANPNWDADEARDARQVLEQLGAPIPASSTH